MPSKNWNEYRNAAQLANLPLITSCFVVVQILSAIRDVILIGLLQPTWLIVLNTATVLLVLCSTVLSQMHRISPRYSHSAAVLGIFCIAAKAISTPMAQGQIAPLYLAITILGTFLSVFSIRYALFTIGVVLVAWTVVAAPILDVELIASNLAIYIIAAVLGIVILQRRITALRHVYELEHRVQTLESILPMCSGCKKTRLEDGSWKSIEEYLEDKKQGLQISHGICPECKKDIYGELLSNKK